MSATVAVAVVSCSSCRPARASRQKSGQPPQPQPPQPQQLLRTPSQSQPPQQLHSQTLSRLSPETAAAKMALADAAAATSGASGKSVRKSAAPRFGRRFTIDCTSSLNYNEVLEWQKSFDQLMASPVGRRLFGEFLKLEHSYCNLEFWLCCERLRSTEDKADYAQQARAIYDRYISPHSSQEVNLDGRVRLCVQQACSANPETADFAEAARQVYALMSFDSYPRFMRSAPMKAIVASRSTETAGESTDVGGSSDDFGVTGN